MRMTLTQLRASLALWKRREKARKAMHRRAQRAYMAAVFDNGHSLARLKARRDKRSRQLAEARKMVALRTAQLDRKLHPLRLRAFDVAESLLGVLEVGGNNRGPMVNKIILSNGGVIGEPWCGDFDAWCYRNAGSKAVSRAWAAVALLGSVLGVRKTTNPQRGDLVRFNFSHTGLFDEWINRAEGTFRTIEGNTGTTGATSDGARDGIHRRDRHMRQVTDFLHVTR